MSNILSSYPVFEDNQVLTASQLNELSGYLDQQNRLTRVKLIGMGTACGLNVSYLAPNEAPDNKDTIQISGGVGITSEGYLFTLGTCNSTKYRPYVLPIPYDPFADIDLWELLPESTEPSTEVNELSAADTGFLDDKVVLLFMECVDVSLKSCLGKACDENGVQRQFNVRKLLVCECQLDIVLSRLKLSCPDDGQFPDKFQLQSISIPRPLFDPESQHSQDYFAFSLNYGNLLASTAVIDNLFARLNAAYDVYEPILRSIYGSNPFLTTEMLQLQQNLNNFLTGAYTVTGGFTYFGMQYVYDLLKDVIKAYDEFKQVSFNLITTCCPNMNCFPKHLMLGEVIHSDDPCYRPTYRNYWTAAAIGEGQSDLLEETKTLHQRIVLMLEKFDFDRVNAPLNLITKVTPSDEKIAALGKREIPWYFQIDQLGMYPSIGTLEGNWSPADKRACDNEQELRLVAYDNNNVGATSPSGPVSTPLHYDLDAYNYLRVGGHLGKPFDPDSTGSDDVSSDLTDLRDRFDLPFKFINLRLKGANLVSASERCPMDDLQTSYLVAAQELRCKLFGSAMAFAPTATVRTQYLASFASGDAAPDSIQDTYGGNFTKTYVLVDGTSLEGDMTAYMEAALQLYDSMPKLIEDFDFGYTIDSAGNAIITAGGFVNLYIVARNAARDLKAALNEQWNDIIYNARPNLSSSQWAVFQNMFTELLRNVDSFLTCCDIHKFLAINAIRLYRLDYLTANDPTLFSNFIRKHAGINHGGGVPEGGTYITVVPGEDVLPSGTNTDTGGTLANTGATSSTTFTSNIRAGATDVNVRQSSQVDAEAASQKVVQELKVKAASLEQNQQRTSIEQAELDLVRLQLDVIDKQVEAIIKENPNAEAASALAQAVSSQGISADTIIADFFLPYICCLDEECVNIPSPTSDELVIPAIALPAYIRYEFDDYAWTPSPVGTNGELESETGGLLVDVSADLVYDTIQFSPSEVVLGILSSQDDSQLYGGFTRAAVTGTTGTTTTTTTTSTTANTAANTRTTATAATTSATAKATATPEAADTEAAATEKTKADAEATAALNEDTGAVRFTATSAATVASRTFPEGTVSVDVVNGVQQFRFIPSDSTRSDYHVKWNYQFTVGTGTALQTSSVGSVDLYVSCCFGGGGSNLKTEWAETDFTCAFADGVITLPMMIEILNNHGVASSATTVAEAAAELVPIINASRGGGLTLEDACVLGRDGINSLMQCAGLQLSWASGAIANGALLDFQSIMFSVGVDPSTYSYSGRGIDCPPNLKTEWELNDFTCSFANKDITLQVVLDILSNHGVSSSATTIDDAVNELLPIINASRGGGLTLEDACVLGRDGINGLMQCAGLQLSWATGAIANGALLDFQSIMFSGGIEPSTYSYSGRGIDCPPTLKTVWELNDFTCSFTKDVITLPMMLAILADHGVSSSATTVAEAAAELLPIINASRGGGLTLADACILGRDGINSLMQCAGLQLSWATGSIANGALLDFQSMMFSGGVEPSTYSYSGRGVDCPTLLKTQWNTTDFTCSGAKAAISLSMMIDMLANHGVSSDATTVEQAASQLVPIINTSGLDLDDACILGRDGINALMQCAGIQISWATAEIANAALLDFQRDMFGGGVDPATYSYSGEGIPCRAALKTSWENTDFTCKTGAEVITYEMLVQILSNHNSQIPSNIDLAAIEVARVLNLSKTGLSIDDACVLGRDGINQLLQCSGVLFSWATQEIANGAVIQFQQEMKAGGVDPANFQYNGAQISCGTKGGGTTGETGGTTGEAKDGTTSEAGGGTATGGETAGSTTTSSGETATTSSTGKETTSGTGEASAEGTAAG